MPDGSLLRLMPAPKRAPDAPKDTFDRALARWIYLKIPTRKRWIKRMRAMPESHWAHSDFFPWAAANLLIPVLPCEGVTLLPVNEEEEDAVRAHWAGWLDAMDRLTAMVNQWPVLSRAERESALEFAEFMAADFIGFRWQLHWMIAHFADPVAPRTGD